MFPISSYKTFLRGLFCTCLVGFLLIGFALFWGNKIFFLWLNRDLGKVGDIFFKYFTTMGETLPWVLLFLWVIFKNRKMLLLVLFALLISTFIVQGLKNYVFADVCRPAVDFAHQMNLLHTVPGVYLVDSCSFPSGHTSSAFVLFLLLCIILDHKRWIAWVGFVLALLVGYSRIYLAEHFPIDVGAGMLVAAFSVWMALQLQYMWVSGRFSRPKEVKEW